MSVFSFIFSTVKFLKKLEQGFISLYCDMGFNGFVLLTCQNLRFLKTGLKFWYLSKIFLFRL